MTVRVELVGGKIAATVPWDGGRGRDLAKEAGGRWSQPKKQWMFSLNWEQCLRLREVFGPSLVIGPNLAAWARQEKGRRDEIEIVQNVDLSEMQPIPRIEKYAPKLAKAMYNRGYQTVVPMFAKLVPNFLLADQPGLGKCIETLGAMIETERDGRILIVCPSTAMRSTWVPEITKWLPKGTYTIHVCEGSRDERNETIRDFLKTPPPSREGISFQFLIVNAEMLRQPFIFRDKRRIDNVDSKGNPKPASHPMLFHVEWDLVIGDEVHKYLRRANPKAQSTGGLNQVGLGFCQLRYRDGNGRLGLTGTPMNGRPKNLWGTLRWLDPERYTSEWGWTGQYYESEENRYSNTGITYTNELKPGAEKALAKELSTIMLRRTKPELRKTNPAWAPPDKQYIEVYVDLSLKQQAIYQQVLRDAELQLNGETLPVNGVLAIITRLKQAAGCAAKLSWKEFSKTIDTPHVYKKVKVKRLMMEPQLPSAKFDWLVDTFLPSRGIEPKGEGEGTNKVVIASQFTSFIHLWEKELERIGIPSWSITGDTKPRDRDPMVYDFQNNPTGPRVMLLNTNAGGVSITLDKFADDVVIMDETWVPDEQTQVEDRVHRTSNPDHFVNVYYVRSRNTVEEEIAAAVAEKDDTQLRILDGERGVEWAKQKFGVKVK